MNSPSASDVSLYELALAMEPPPPVLQVSPATLKSVLDSILQLLIEQEMPAVVWAKLPRGDVWQLEVERYATLVGVPKAIYLFKSQRDEGEDAGAVNLPLSSNGDEDVSKLIVPSPAASVIVNVPLAPESQLRREYFLVIWSAQFRGVLLAHRPRSIQQVSKTIPLALVDSVAMSGQLGQITTSEEPPERKQLLLTVCSFEQRLVEQILAGLEQAIAASQAIEDLVPEASAYLPDGSKITEQWQQFLTEMPVTAPADLDWLGRLFGKQLQHQEENWQRGTIYRKQAELAETLRIQNEELLDSLRLKDEFLNNVGQELRTPLTTIKTALSLLNSPSLKPNQRQRYMDLIAKECDRQSSLITSLLNLVQLEQVVDQTTLPPLKISDVVPGVVSTYQPLAEEKGVMLAYTVPEDLPTVSCVNNWLRQIVINLLHNSIKFTPRGGQVWVRAKQQGDYVQLEFRDTGIGISPSEIPKIFDRFYRVRQSGDDSSGAGLGLTIVQQLLLHCGGSISVKSKIGEGSVFNVLLPIHKTPSESAPFT
ncbi:DICT sensory domain-containing protein [Pantanalinema sp. GBBB05]|uniref:DICT sensory domain-containing protein n=1 Tax=Pantanalinema sp. GBBB05 TaxID=2604139 RepID=UPI001D2C3FB2|nr:histidine kinase [Pantanalinema sp. GBBB05]